MGKIPVKMRAVVYALSPFQQKVMPGLWKDLPGKISHKITDNWISATLLLGPLIGVHTYVQNFQEKEKMEHRNVSMFNIRKPRNGSLLKDAEDSDQEPVRYEGRQQDPRHSQQTCYALRTKMNDLFLLKR